MKKNLIILTLALLIALPVFGLAAADLTASPVTKAQTNYIDANLDGVCDHYGTDLQGQGGNRQGQGRGQNTRGKGVLGNTKVQSFVDADGNGVCDNLGVNARQGFSRGRNRK